MNHVSGSARRPVDHSTDSNAARPAQHPAIIRPYMTGDAYAECFSTHAVDAFFQQRPATELTGPEMSLLKSLIRVAEALQAVLPRNISLQEWAHRRVPRGRERQVNSSGMVYVGGRSLQYVPLLPSEPQSANSAAQPASDSTAAQPVSVIEDLVLDDDSRYDPDVEAFFQQCPATELTGPEVDLLNSLISASESLQAVLPRCVTLQEWAHRIRSAPQPASDSSAAQRDDECSAVL